MQLAALAAKLPGNSVQPVVEVDQGPAFDVAPGEVPGYVAPSVTIEDWPEGAPVLLMEAAGAVGKSAAAAAVAERLNWPLVRAELAQVGSHSLSGLIQDAVGHRSAYMQEVASGRTGVVVDSLDEAHLRAGTENFLAFLTNVQNSAGGRNPIPGRMPSVVMFSRTDTAEFVRLVFDDAEIPIAHARLDFFDHSGACSFIAAYLRQRFDETRRPEYNVALASPRPFEVLRDRRLQRLAEVLLQQERVRLSEQWPSVADFLGYAPVLIALAESLAVTNPNSASLALDSGDQNGLLRQIVDAILSREQLKFCSHMQPQLHANLPADEAGEIVAATMYTPVEQCVRLAAHVNGGELATDLPAALPNSVRGGYEAAIATFFPDHPFIRSKSFTSIVFSDHVAAVTCMRTEARAALSDPPEKNIDHVGPFFARFLEHEAGSESRVIPENLVEHVMTSWSQEVDLVRSSDSEIRLVLMGESPVLYCIRQDSGNADAVELEFELSELSGAFHVTKPTKRTTILTDAGIIVGRRGQSIQLGPRTVMVADEMVVEVETLRIDTDKGRHGGAFLAARSLLANYLVNVECGPGDLRLYVADPPPRLRQYTHELRYRDISIDFARLIDLRNILTSFRPSAKGGLSVKCVKLEHKIIKGNGHRQQILEYLMSNGSISKQGAWYSLDLNSLGTLGFSVTDLNSGEPSSAILAFLATCDGQLG